MYRISILNRVLYVSLENAIKLDQILLVSPAMEFLLGPACNNFYFLVWVGIIKFYILRAGPASKAYFLQAHSPISFTLPAFFSRDYEIHIFNNNNFLYFAIIMISRARKIVTKFHKYSYEIVMSPVIVNSYKNGLNNYQIVKLTINCIIENYKNQNLLV